MCPLYISLEGGTRLVVFCQAQKSLDKIRREFKRVDRAFLPHLDPGDNRIMQPSKLSMKGAVHKNKGELIVPGIALCAISSNIGESEIAVNAANETLSLVN